MHRMTDLFLPFVALKRRYFHLGFLHWIRRAFSFDSSFNCNWQPSWKRSGSAAFVDFYICNCRKKKWVNGNGKAKNFIFTLFSFKKKGKETSFWTRFCCLSVNFVVGLGTIPSPRPFIDRRIKIARRFLSFIYIFLVWKLVGFPVCCCFFTTSLIAFHST